LYNMDETGVMLSMLNSVKVLVGKDDMNNIKPCRMPSHTSLCFAANASWKVVVSGLVRHSSGSAGPQLAESLLDGLTLTTFRWCCGGHRRTHAGVRSIPGLVLALELRVIDAMAQRRGVSE
ncbi:hypothetical protein EJ07DRAFT_136777, partial [Lizonia empirigonia]